jgi:hypothetical protein
VLVYGGDADKHIDVLKACARLGFLSGAVIG